MPYTSYKTINVGIVLPPSDQGGHFQLALSIADSLLKYSHRYNITILYYDKHMLNWLADLTCCRSLIHIEKRTSLHRLNAFVNLMVHSKILPMSGRKQSTELQKANIDLLITPFHGLFGYMNSMPYVVTITSILHKHYPNPPVGYSWRNKFIANVIIKNAAKFSVLSVVDSQQGLTDLSKFYPISVDKIRVIPHLPSGYIYDNSGMGLVAAERTLANFALPAKYIFYPSQFTYGKNHINLLQSLRCIEKRFGTKVPVVFVGRPDNSYEDVIHLIKELNMNDQVFHLGYVSDKEIVALYKKAVALAYPSLFGPTNLPPIEAMILGTPVLCSNLFSMPEQVGDAGLFFDPFSIEDMAEKIYMIWTDESLRERLKQKGYERIKDLNQENYARQWENTIDDALASIEYNRS